MAKNYILIFLLLIVYPSPAQPTDVFSIARTGTLAQAKELYASNPKAFDEINAEGYSPLILACYRGNTEVAKFLVDHKADLNYKSSMGTALAAAVVKGNSEMTKYLLEQHADPNIADANGTTPLIYATMFKQYDHVTMLVKAKANPDHKDSRGNSAIDYAILADDDKLMLTLKSK